MITDDLENKEKAEKIHHLLQGIEEQQQRAKQRFKYRTLPFLIVIAILLFTALYLIYPYLSNFMETIIEIIEEQPNFNHDQKTPYIMAYEIDRRGLPIALISTNIKPPHLDHLS
ncbi:hypothetical protein [Atribacter laminatus]|uniref:Uncharacterized protein n=1 Tax=Atribacter laminatus TaxID=2847778 RepID=A0A7T1ANI6_ATRLM|nr:hypothetical protein [Atribacter laminatus]QPM69176.1 hypothetical protein RT761_02404 [Atribacter laminatus]